MLTLFEDENVITQSGEGAVTLTTHRICYEYKELGRSYNQNIMLEHITSCENFYKAEVWMMVLAVTSLLGGIYVGYDGNSDLAFILLLSAIAFGIFYFWTRRNFIIIGSPSTNMRINVKGLERSQILDFINNVEQTKHKRMILLNKRS